MTNYNINYTFTAKNSQLQNSLKKTSSSVKDFNKSLSKTNDIAKKSITKTNSLASSVRGLIGAYVGFQSIKMGINTISQFGESMSKVKALTRATGKEFFDLREQAKGLGATTRYSASQVAEGMSFMAMAGLKTDKIMKLMPATLDLATAGNIDLASAADIATNVMSQMGATAKELPNIIDVLAKTAGNANTNIMELGEASKMALPITKMFGLTIEQSAASLGVLANRGIKGTLAGTGLRRALLRLVKPSKEANKYLKQYGITQDKINVKKHGFSKVLKNLEPIIKNDSASMEVFGIQGIGIAKILSENTEELDKMTQSLQKSGGYAKETAKIMNDNLGGDIKNLKSSIEGLTLASGDKGLTGGLRRATQGATIFFRALNGGDIDKLSDAMKGVLSVVNKIGWAIGKATTGWKNLFAIIGRGKETKDFLAGGDKKAISRAIKNKQSGESLAEANQRLQQEDKLQGYKDIIQAKRFNKEVLKDRLNIDINHNNTPQGTTSSVFNSNPKNMSVVQNFSGGMI